MSPLLGSIGGSSEYAFRGTLDDWPNDFSSSLTSQNLTGISPLDPSPIANLTVSGINYKIRVVVENINASLSVDGGVTYLPAKSSDAAIFVRDNTAIKIKLQQTSGNESDFNKTYTIPIKIGKRQANWVVTTRSIDNTPNSFTFTPLLNQEVGVAVTSNLVTIAGLETGFAFPISRTGDGSYYRNGAGPFITGNVVNGDKIYLATQTPSTFSTPKNLSLSVGSYTTSWGILTRDPDASLDPFSFTGIGSATLLGTSYVSNQITISGADVGLGLTTRISGPNAFYEIRKSDNTLRYTDGLGSPTYWQNGISTSFNGDKLQVRIDSSTNYNTTATGILTVSDQSAPYIVTTRPTPYNTIPSIFGFTALTDQPRGTSVSSAPITLSILDNIPGTFGTAYISNSTSGINAQFSVNSTTTWISPPITVSVKNGDVIRLKMTTPNDNLNNGVTNSSITFKVDGVDTRQNLPGGNGYLTQTGSQQATWNVSTIARSCTINPFTINADIPTASLNADIDSVDFTVGGWNSDCQMKVEVTSDSSAYNFIAENGSLLVTPTKTLTNVAPGTTLRLRVRSSASYVTSVTSTVTISNTGITPLDTETSTWVITTTPDTTPASLIFTTPTNNSTTLSSQDSFTLAWSATNCTSIKSSTWAPTPTSLTGSANLIAPVVSTYTPITATYTLRAYVSPNALNYNSFPTDGIGSFISTSRTITVNPDTTPVFTPSGFTTVTTQSLNTFITSDPIVISSISVPVDGEATVDGVNIDINAVTFSDNTTSISPINSGDSISLRVKSSANYNTTTTGYLKIITLIGDVLALKPFSVTTGTCVPTTTTQTITQVVDPLVVGTASSVTIKYYTSTRYKNASNLFVTNNTGDLNPYNNNNTTLLFGDQTTSITSFYGTATDYFESIVPGYGYYLGDPTTITSWATLINVYYYAFTSEYNHPPTLDEIAWLTDPTNIQNYGAIRPSSYSNSQGFYTGLRGFIISSTFTTLLVGPGARNTTYPIYNSCPDLAFNSKINDVGGYVNVSTLP